MRRPREEDDDNDAVDEHAEEEDGHAAHLLDDESEAEGAERVRRPVRHEDEAHLFDAVGAGHVALQGGRVSAFNPTAISNVIDGSRVPYIFQQSVFQWSIMLLPPSSQLLTLLFAKWPSRGGAASTQFTSPGGRN